MRRRSSLSLACALVVAFALGAVPSPAHADEGVDESVVVEAPADDVESGDELTDGEAVELEAQEDDAIVEGDVDADALGAQAGGGSNAAARNAIRANVAVLASMAHKGTGYVGTYFRNYILTGKFTARVNITLRVTDWGDLTDVSDPYVEVRYAKVASGDEDDVAEVITTKKITKDADTIELPSMDAQPTTIVMQNGAKLDAGHLVTIESNVKDLTFELTVNNADTDGPNGENYHSKTVGKTTRFWGGGALDTMQAVVRTDDVFTAETVDTVIIATSDGYWDALSAASIAGVLDAPVLITDGKALSDQTKSEIDRLKPEHAIIAGGEFSVSKAVLDEVAKVVPDTKRISGASAADTAVAIYNEGKGKWGDTAIVASSTGYWDALSIAPYAFAQNAPIFLTSTVGDKQMLSDSSMSALLGDAGFKRVIIVGGGLSVSEKCENDQLKKDFCTKHNVSADAIVRLSGRTAIDTSAAIVKWEVGSDMGVSHLTVATNSGYWDALCGAPLCGMQNSALVLVDPEGTSMTAIDAAFDLGKPDHVHVLGGSLSVSDSVFDKVCEKAN